MPISALNSAFLALASLVNEIKARTKTNKKTNKLLKFFFTPSILTQKSQSQKQ
jgi:hypothetical protein